MSLRHAVAIADVMLPEELRRIAPGFEQRIERWARQLFVFSPRLRTSSIGAMTWSIEIENDVPHLRLMLVPRVNPFLIPHDSAQSNLALKDEAQAVLAELRHSPAAIRNIMRRSGERDGVLRYPMSRLLASRSKRSWILRHRHGQLELRFPELKWPSQDVVMEGWIVEASCRIMVLREAIELGGTIGRRVCRLHVALGRYARSSNDGWLTIGRRFEGLLRLESCPMTGVIVGAELLELKLTSISASGFRTRNPVTRALRLTPLKEKEIRG